PQWRNVGQYTSRSYNQLPYARIGHKRQSMHRRTGDKPEGRIEHTFYQRRILGEKQNVLQQPARGVPRRERVNPILGALGEKIERGDGSGRVLPNLRQLPREWRSVSQDSPAVRPAIGTWARKQRDIAGPALRNRGLPR